MSNISSIALGGIQKAAENIVEATQSFSSGDEPFSPAAIVDLLQSETTFKANLKVLEVDSDLNKHILDILA